MAGNHLRFLQQVDPDRELSFLASSSPIFPRIGLLIPLAILFIAFQLYRRRAELRAGVHAMGISLVLTTIIVLSSVVASLAPFFDHVLTFVETPESYR